MPVCTCTDTVRTDEGITWLPLLFFIWSSGTGSLTERETQHFLARLADQQAPVTFPFLCGPLSRIGVTSIYNQAMPSPLPFF